ncbi:hypothetical protein [Longirhabdus pacifica]|uniref:hypothetical protein n=1 Tax=Longirhabdus pacifica TaxID=2305227 RepID=UPI001008B49E|nr:hypothetical protein [Longirhabdus pacifica]
MTLLWVDTIDLTIKALGLLSLIFTGISVFVAVQRFKYEKNRDIYIRRLNEVYAPLYGLVIKQEMMRALIVPEHSFSEMPIITMESMQQKMNSELLLSSPFIVKRDDFLNILNDANKGLARPQLLIFMHQYEMLLHLEHRGDIGAKKVQTSIQRIEVERLLVHEIIAGYRATLRKLAIDDVSTFALEKEIFDVKINE